MFLARANDVGRGDLQLQESLGDLHVGVREAATAGERVVALAPQAPQDTSGAQRAGNLVEYDYLPMECLNDAQRPFLDHDTLFVTEDLRARGDVMVTTHGPTLLER